jgi:hypothetical protein
MANWRTGSNNTTHKFAFNSLFYQEQIYQFLFWTAVIPQMIQIHSHHLAG